MLATHDLPPIYDEHSQVLILGTMPSPKSKEVGFYYAHPQNRFWKVLSAVFQTEIPLERSGRIAFLQEKHIALWDVIAQCEIDGAKDASIRTVVANDLPFLLQRTQIHTVFTTGQTAAKWYRRLLLPQTALPAIPLPSSSPANCAIPFARMVEEYSQIRNALQQKQA